MDTQPNFPEHRLHDPKRQAELAVYRDLQAASRPGVALYSVRPGPNSPELDFAIWLQNVARVALEVKGGRYCAAGGEWFLEGPGGAMPKDNPLLQAWDAAMGLRNFLGERLGQRHCPFVIPAVVFPDMEPDPDIEALTAGSQTHVLWGAGDIAGRLAAIAAEVNVKFPPAALDIQRETALLLPGTAGAETVSPSAGDGERGRLDPRQVIIEHVDVVNVYTTSAA